MHSRQWFGLSRRSHAQDGGRAGREHDPAGVARFAALQAVRGDAHGNKSRRTELHLIAARRRTTPHTRPFDDERNLDASTSLTLIEAKDSGCGSGEFFTKAGVPSTFARSRSVIRSGALQASSSSRTVPIADGDSADTMLPAAQGISMPKRGQLAAATLLPLDENADRTWRR